MKLITRNTDYAVRALCVFAGKKDQIVTVDELVEKTRIPRPFLRKILQALNKSGIIESFKGRGGGFKFARNPDKVYIVDLIKIFQGKFQLNECFFKNRICPDLKVCRLRAKIGEIEKKVLKELSNITISSIL